MKDPKVLADTLIKLKRLAEDQRGKPEGEAALRKINELSEKYPDIRIAITPIWNLSMRDIGFMKRSGIGIDGSWTGTDIFDAIRVMQEDYCRRITRFMIQHGFSDDDLAFDAVTIKLLKEAQ